jgi:soluble lytic murein transglycosylase
MRNPLLPKLYPLVLALLAGGAIAHAAATPAPADLAAQRAGFARALEAAESRPLAAFPDAARAYAHHPLAPYLDYAALRRQLDRADAQTVKAFLDAHPDLPVSAALRDQALRALARREDWTGFRTLYAGSADAELRCADLLSRRSAAPDAAWIDAGLALWLNGRSQPARCDAAFDVLRQRGLFTAERTLERIALAAAEHNLGLMRYLARGLPAAQAARVNGYADYLAAPAPARTDGWPDDAPSRRIALLGVARVAKGDPGAAEALFAALLGRFSFDAAQRGEALSQIALWSAASYLPDSARRFAIVPAGAWDARLHEWQFREALARGDEPAALAAIAAMPQAQRADPRWRYFEARLRERAGDAAARDILGELSAEPNYYGFLAAERIGAPYALCPRDAAPGESALRRRLAARPGFVRAMELYALGRIGWARREWDALKSALSPEERRVAVALADAAGWHDRGPFTLTAGEDLTYYRLRFPLPFERQIRREARKHGLDPAWVVALIRAESAWAPDARSHANARGLMQLLPATARMEAARRGRRYPGDAGLFDPKENLSLGIAHLATMLEQHDGLPFLATAAYNAGPTPVARWLAQRPVSDVDLWIETIPYRETREYVARILAFATIYDWRLQGHAVPIGSRALGQNVPSTARHPFACPIILPGSTS